MNNPKPTTGEMQKLLEELAAELSGKVHEDGTYHVTEELMRKMLPPVAYIRTLESEHREMRQMWELMKTESVRDPKAIPVYLHDFAAGVLTSVTLNP